MVRDTLVIDSYPKNTVENVLCPGERYVCILDLAGEMFTDAGRDLVLRRIAESGTGQINYVAWKHEYIHHCNQLAAFSGGRLLGYAVMERSMPRVRPYTELAFRTEIAEGGFPKGTGDSPQ